jgi:undecaprenyl diphosphate synthase
MTDDKINKRKEIHVGIIPDGNRRYALKHNKPVWKGHWDGAKKIERFLDWCIQYPEIKRVSIFALSTENLNRPKKEISELWKVYRETIRNFSNDPRIKDNEIQIRILGNDGVWNPAIKDAIHELVNSTKHYSRHILNILLAYGSKFEIANAIKKMAGKPIGAIDRFLLVKEPLDLLIRTGDQYRLSNFMLYQASYAEIYFSKTLWPEFTKQEFEKIIKWYHQQQKKFGK